MFGTLSLVFQDLRNAQSVIALTFIGKIWGIKDLLNGEEDKGEEVMERIKTKAERITGFLYCPRCGLRRPKSEMSGYYNGCCPVCGSKMVEEGLIPYYSKEYQSHANHILFFR